MSIHQPVFRLAVVISALALCLAAFGHRTLGDAALLGQTPKQILAKLGVPTSVRSGAQSLEFLYDQGASKSAFRVVFHADRACFVTEQRKAPLGEPVPNDRVYLGQSATDAIRVLGQPTGSVAGAGALQLHFGNTRLMLGHGRVLGVSD